MIIYRVENPNNHIGPFNIPTKDMDPFDLLLYGPNSIDPPPARKADVVAQLTGHTRPFNLPAPPKDGIDFNRFSDEDHKYVAGFVSLRQYCHWFETKLIRQALYMDHTMVLRCYEVPDEDVKVGGHQVVFRHDHAKLVYTFTEDEAVKGRRL